MTNGDSERIAAKNTTINSIANIFPSELREGFALRSLIMTMQYDYDYTSNKALIDQLIRSIRENIQTLVFRTDLTPFSSYFKTAVRIFPVWTSQLVNKSIV